MDCYSYETLESDYNNFTDPIVQVFVDDENIHDNKGGVSISDVLVDLTCGFEAGQAAFSLYDCYDMVKTKFEYDKVKKYIMLGSTVRVAMGYGMTTREVFRGIIVRVDFVVDETDAPHVRVTAMDVKGIMMANHYHKRLMSDFYSGAIKEIFAQDVYMGLVGPTGVISELSISDTPDMFSLSADVGESDKTIEMVGESDYEFIVRCAKRFNYEFFCIGGQVLFREAKSDPSTLLSFSNTSKIFSLNVSYDITGLVSSVTVRGLDAGKAKVIESTMRNSNKISGSSQAKAMINGSEYIYVDPTVTAKDEAQRRAWYVFDDMAYRFGTLDMEIMGIPEVIPGRFIDLNDYGTAVSNTFYVTSVQHHMDRDGRYTTRVIGKAQTLQTDLASMV